MVGGGLTTDVPAYAVLGTKVEEEIFLGVVEIWLKSYAGVVFFLRKDSGTEVDAVVFGAGLEHDSFWGDGGEGVVWVCGFE